MVIISPDHKAGYFWGGGTLGVGWLTSHDTIQKANHLGDNSRGIPNVTVHQSVFTLGYLHPKIENTRDCAPFFWLGGTSIYIPS